MAPSIIVVIVTTNYSCPNLVLVATITSLSPSCVFQSRLLVLWLVCSSDDCISHKTLKVHFHAIQCFYVDILRSKMAARRLGAAAPANESQALAALFFLHRFGASRSIDVGASISWQLAPEKSFLSRTKLSLRSRKRKQKDKLAHEQW